MKKTRKMNKTKESIYLRIQGIKAKLAHKKQMPNRRLITEVFKALGLSSQFQSIDVIDQGVAWVIQNQDSLIASLPKRCCGNWSLLRSNSDLVRRKALLAFARRLCIELEYAIVRRRKQVRDKAKKCTVSLYSYKLLTN